MPCLYIPFFLESDQLNTLVTQSLQQVGSMDKQKLRRKSLLAVQKHQEWKCRGCPV